MTPADLLTLAERCEQAAGADRELDALIAVAIQIDCRKGLADDLEYLSPIRADDHEALAREGGAYWFHCRSGKSMRRADNYTASLDVAMGLVPEGLEWAVRWVLDLNNGGALGHVRLASGVGCNAVGDTPALALTAAALRARAATLGDAK